MQIMNSSFEEVNCPACLIKTNPIWLQDHPKTCYRRCLTCGTIYASPRLPTDMRLRELQKNYDSTDESRRWSALRRPKLSEEAAIIKRFIDRGRILDVGCGNGYMFEFFQDSHWIRDGIEISLSSAEYARSTFRASVHQGDLTSACYSTGQFDLITMIDMLYFLDNPLQDFLEARRIIKPDGVLAIEIPGLEYILLKNHGMLSLILNKKWDRLHSNSPYINWFSYEGVKRLITASDFEMIFSAGVGIPEREGLLPKINILLAKLVNQASVRFHKVISWAPKILLIAKPV